MDTMADVSKLLTEFNARKHLIANAAEKSALVKDIDGLKLAWNSGNAGDAKKHATNVTKFAKKHRTKFTDSFWQTIESISSGDSVPQKTDSSTRPTSKHSRIGSKETATSKGSKQSGKIGSETAATSKGSTPKQPVKNKPQNEKESEQESTRMEVQGIKFKAQQLQSEKNMAQQLQVIRNRIEELAAAMRPHPNDVKNSNSKSEDCNTLAEIILNQSTEVLNVYRQEKASYNRIHVEHATIRQGLKAICDAFINANTENMETIDIIEELGKCLKAKYVRISDTENRLKEMFQNATGREYKGPGNKGGKGKKENQTDPVEVFQQLINDMDRQLVEYTRQQDRIHQDSVKSKEEVENLQKRISDTEKMLKEMFKNVTGRKYKESSNKDGKRKKENHPDPVEIFQQSIYDLEKQLVDYTRMTDTQERLREMFQHVTGQEYKGPSISDEKEKKENQYNTIEKLHQMIADMDKQLVHYTRMTDTQERLREMFQHVTGREYKGPSISDGKGNTKENQHNTVEELYQMISDMDKQLVDITSQQDKIHKDNVEPKQEFEHLQKRMTDTEKRLRDMFQHVTGREYKGPSISNGKGKTKENQYNTVEELHQMISDMDKQLVDHTRISDIEKELKKVFQNVTGREYKYPVNKDGNETKVNQTDPVEVLQQLISDINGALLDQTSLSKQLSNEKQLNEKLSREKDELLIRLSQHVSAKLTNNNPDIADLSDENRPTKLGELYSELYDNEWTDAYEVLIKNMNEKETTRLLLEVFTTSYAYCLRHSQNQEMLLEGLLILPASILSGKEGFGTNGFEEMEKLLKSRPTLGDIEQKMLMDLRKATKSISAGNVVQVGVDYVKKDLTKNDSSDVFRTYVQKCLHLCWLMCQQSPRMFIDVNSAKCSGTKFDKSTFREYLKFGKKVDYVVWLPLYLHKGGSLVKKGVANGK